MAAEIGFTKEMENCESRCYDVVLIIIDPESEWAPSVFLWALDRIYWSLYGSLTMRIWISCGLHLGIGLLAEGDSPSGRIVAVHPGKDGHVRVAQLKSETTWIRSISKTCLLEVADEVTIPALPVGYVDFTTANEIAVHFCAVT